MPQNFLHSQDKAVIAKSGINRQGKQNTTKRKQQNTKGNRPI